MENAYGRAVRREGNPAALKLLEEVFEVCDRKWRGIGMIPQSGCYRLRPEFREHDAEAASSPWKTAGDSGIERVHQRADPPRPEKAARVPGLRQGVYSANAVWRNHGLFGGSLRGVLRLRPAFERQCQAHLERH